MSAAARLRRLDAEARIVVVEQGSEVSFANCGLPYFLSGEIARRGDLLLRTPESLAATLGLEVRVNTLATDIDRAARSLGVTICIQPGVGGGFGFSRLADGRPC